MRIYLSWRWSNGKLQATGVRSQDNSGWVNVTGVLTPVTLDVQRTSHGHRYNRIERKTGGITLARLQARRKLNERKAGKKEEKRKEMKQGGEEEKEVERVRRKRIPNGKRSREEELRILFGRGRRGEEVDDRRECDRNVSMMAENLEECR